MKRVGLFIGIDKYGNDIQPLNCACNDAHSVGACFIRKQFDKVEYLLDDKAISSTIASRVMRLTKSLGEGDLFVFYFAGHGREVNGQYTFIASDG